MPAKKKAKKMTQREKDARARARARLREEGILPPKKKPLNRKKYIEESVQICKNARNDAQWEFGVYLDAAVSMMLGWGDYRPTPETVGCAKAMRIAAKLIEREKMGLTTEGTEEFYMNEIMPIFEA